jgi:hypothetical protein
MDGRKDGWMDRSLDTWAGRLVGRKVGRADLKDFGTVVVDRNGWALWRKSGQVNLDLHVSWFYIFSIKIKINFSPQFLI